MQSSIESFKTPLLLPLKDQTKKIIFLSMAKAWFPDGAINPNLALLAMNIGHAEYWSITYRNMVRLMQLMQLLKTAKSAMTVKQLKKMTKNPTKNPTEYKNINLS